MNRSFIHIYSVPAAYLAAVLLLLAAGGFLAGIHGILAVFSGTVLTWSAGAGFCQRFLPGVYRSVIRIPLAWLTGFIVLSMAAVAAYLAGIGPEYRFVAWLAVLPVSILLGISGVKSKDLDRKIRADIAWSGWGAIIPIALILAAIVPVFMNVGAGTGSGFAYRAYFNGDFLKHVALTELFSLSGFPPDNPYFSGEPLHYYWFIYPYVNVLSTECGAGPGAESAFLIFSLVVPAVFLFLLSGLIREAFRLHPIALGILMTGMVFGASYEGALLAGRIITEGKPFWTEIGHYNIDGYSRWIWTHPQIDSIYRSVMYTPQHLLALTLILTGMAATRKSSRTGSWVLHGFLAGLSAGVSTFVGILGLTALGIRLSVRRIRVIIPVLAAAAAGPVILVLTGALALGGDNLTVFTGLGFRDIVMIPLVNFGFLVVLGVPGIVIALRRRQPLSVSMAWLGIVSAIFLFWVRLAGNPSDVGLKSGLVLAVVLAYGVAALWRYYPVRSMVFLAFLAVPAVPTAVMDIWSTWNLDTPRYISFVSDSDMAAARCIRETTPRHWVIQADPNRSPRGYFSLIPTFANRRTSLGDPMHGRIFQIPSEDYAERLRLIKTLLATPNPDTAVNICRKLGIDAVYIGAPERTAYPEGLRKLSAFPVIKCSKDVNLYIMEPAVTATGTPDGGVTLVSHETEQDRQLLPASVDVESVFPDDPRRLVLKPGQTVSIPRSGDMAYYLLPRLGDMGIPDDISLTSRESTEKGTRFCSDPVILPPGKYLLRPEHSMKIESIRVINQSAEESDQLEPFCAGESRRFRLSHWTVVRVEMFTDIQDRPVSVVPEYCPISHSETDRITVETVR